MMSPSRRRLLEVMGVGLVGIAGCGSPEAGQEPGASDLEISSPAFSEGEPIPTRYTCDGTDESPPLSIAGVPESALSLALILDDPDAPGGTFTHWLLWNLPTDLSEISRAIPRDPTLDSLSGARQGTNDFGEIGYRGPCPPGDTVHTYRFRLYALDSMLDVQAGDSAAALQPAIEDHQVAVTRFTGRYG